MFENARDSVGASNLTAGSCGRSVDTRVGSPLGELAALLCSVHSLIRESRTSLVISVAARASVAISADGAAFSRDISLCEPYHVQDTLIM